MPLRLAVLLLISALPVHAADPPARFPLQTSGGKWTAYEPVGELPPGSSRPELRQHGDEVMVSRSYRLSVNRVTGAVNLNPRPAFPWDLESIQADGDSPVFWSTPYGNPSPRPFFIRDWTTGEKVGEPTLPPVFWPGYIDPHGMATALDDVLYLTDPTGGNVRQLTWTELGVNGYEKVIAGCEKWLAIAYRATATGQQRLAIFDRATLQLKTDQPQTGQGMSLQGDILARQLTSAVVLYRLPGLTDVAGVPQDSPSSHGIVGYRLVEGGLWVLQELTNEQGGVFRFYDLEAYPEVRLRHRVLPPGALFRGFPSDPVWLATGDSLSVVDEARTLWIWKCDPVDDPRRPLVTLERSKGGAEGDTAQVRVALSYLAAHPVQVTLRAVSGSAVEGSDFAPWTETITIPPGTGEALADIPILADAVLEPNETFEVAMENATGALPDAERVSLTIAANGYNLEVNPPKVVGGQLRWTQIYGSDGKVLVGHATPDPGTNGIAAGVVMVDLETGNLIARLNGLGAPLEPGGYVFRDGLVIAGGSSVSAWRTDTGAPVASWLIGGQYGTFAGAIDATKVLVRRRWPDVLELRRLSDGGMLASIPMEENASVALSHDARNGQPSTIHVYRTGGAIFDRMKLNRLSTLDPDTLAETAGPVWRSYSQFDGDGAKIMTVWEHKVIVSTWRGITAMDLTTGTTLWHVPSQMYGTVDYGFGISGNVMAVCNLMVTSLEQPSTVYFIDLTRGAIIAKLRPEDLSTDDQWWGGAITARDDGWTLTSGKRSFRVRRMPDRPNVKFVTPVIMDNRATTLSVVPLEGFSGTFPIRVSEFEEMSEDRAAANRLFSGVPVDLQLDADGVDFSISANRPVTGLEKTWLRATAPGRQALLAGFVRTMVNPHLVTVPNGGFTTGGPFRSTRARSVAAGDTLLAVGYPIEPLPGGIRTGVVDLYHPQTGAFLRSIEVAAGSEGKRFGHAVGVSGNKVIVGAPGDHSMGRAFAYDGTTGALIQEFILKGKAGEFGSEIDVNSRWIAISAPGPSQPRMADSKKKAPGTVMVFDAATLKPVLTKTTSGEGLGTQIALSGDRLFVSAPGAPYKKMLSVGVVRAYAVPKGTQLGTILPRIPRALESFGQELAASGSVVVIGGEFDETVNAAALQVHAPSDLRFLGFHAMPGDRFGYSRVTAHDDWMIGRGQSVRFFRPGTPRPVASRRIIDPGGPVPTPTPYFWDSNMAVHGDFFYWADYAPKRMAMPEIPAAATSTMLAGAAAAGDPFEVLSRHRGDASLPARAVRQESTDGSLQFLLQADPNVPPGMDLWFEVSADLNRWDPVLQWRQDAPGWRDENGALLEVLSDGRVSLGHRSEAGRVFFRTRAASH